MPTWLRCARRFHTYCVDQLIYPLVLSSLLACAIFAGRVYLSQATTFRFLIWNLFLAWIPYLCSLAIALLHRRYPGRGWYLLLPGLVWLIFLPNAPYIITDMWHLDERPPVPTWYDIGMLATFSWTGCFLAVVSLNIMQNLVKEFFGRATSWLFVLGSIGLSGLGIYLGRFRQWNSWDLILQPHSVLTDVVSRFAHPVRNPQVFGVTFLFAAFLLVCYVTFVSVEHRRVAAPPRE
jgi:uncharacterized membrane protein